MSFLPGASNDSPLRASSGWWGIRRGWTRLDLAGLGWTGNRKAHSTMDQIYEDESRRVSRGGFTRQPVNVAHWEALIKVQPVRHPSGSRQRAVRFGSHDPLPICWRRREETCAVVNLRLAYPDAVNYLRIH